MAITRCEQGVQLPMASSYLPSAAPPPWRSQEGGYEAVPPLRRYVGQYPVGRYAERVAAMSTTASLLYSMVSRDTTTRRMAASYAGCLYIHPMLYTV